MKLEVKNIKTFRGMEGMGFNCTLYIDGRKAGMVIDDARGGSYHYEISGDDYKNLRDYAKSLPHLPCEWKTGVLFEQDLDSIIGKLVDNFENDKRMKRFCKTSLVYSLKTDKPGQFWKQSGGYSPEKAQKIRAEFGDNLLCIYNETV